MIRAALLALAVIAAGLSPPAWAAGTLETIRERGAVRLGHRLSSVPFSYVDAEGRVMGYSHELAMKIVEAIRTHLDMPELPVELVPITSANRIRRLHKGEFDFECGSTTHNRARESEAAFSLTIFVVGTRLLVPRDSSIEGFADLSGRRVVTTAGTTSERLLRDLKENARVGLTLITARDHGESFLTLATGRADAFMLDDALLYGEMAKSGRADEWRVTGEPRSREAYGCMMRRGDAAMKRLVDQTLREIMGSGEAERVYRRWFMQPIPPAGLNLDFPLSDGMRALFMQPDDRPFQ